MLISGQVAEADLLKLATKTYDRQKELEKQRTIFDRIMAYTSQNYNKDTKEFQPPINAYVGDYYNFIDQAPLKIPHGVFKKMHINCKRNILLHATL